MSVRVAVEELRGRDSEREALDRLLDSAREGRSGALVVRGEAGVGKSALLEHLVQRATGCRVARAVGVESEMELAFAGLHQLCAPMLDHLEELPEPQRDALGTAFGLSAGDAPDGFLVGLAVLGLLAEVAEEQPLVCVVDDAQWLDRASAQALAFVARRLLAESVALVLAVREPSDEQGLAGLPQLAVGGLDDADARELLDSAMQGRLDERVRDRIVAETRGNPLALLELPRGATPAELAGGFGLPGVGGGLASRIEQSFVARLAALPVETQRLVLMAAADPVGDATVLWRAAQRLGIGPDAAVPAEEAGLIEVAAQVRFRHPLVRSATYRAAGVVDRRAVHRALAAASDAEADPDRWAWHCAHAATGPDEAVAGALERSAGRAQRRGGVAAAAAFLEQATELTADPARRGARALAAAQAKLDAAAPDAAYELLTTAAMSPLDELQRARLERLRAQIAFARSRGSDAPPLLLDAARRLEPLDAALARETYLDALGAAIFAGRLSSGCGVRDVARAARAAARTGASVASPRPADLLLDGLATRFTDGYAAGVPRLQRALRAFCREEGGEEDARWLWLACRVAPELWDDEAWHALATRAIALARGAGTLGVLAITVTYRAGVHLHSGEFAAASALIDEADAIAEATGATPLAYTSLVLAAWRGGEAGALELIEAGVQDATERGEGRVIALAGYATAVLGNGLGRYGDALVAAREACAHEDPGLFGWALVELIEAAARSGEQELAVSSLRELEDRTRAAGTDWALGVAARSRALVSEDAAAEAHHREAVRRLGRCRIAVDLARAHLLYGEWLRRARRRVDAREELRRAHALFTEMGAEAFARRAERELVATGETTRRATVATRDELTPQEARVARMARDGVNNQQIATELFISRKTVEYHLHKVFTKLGISSRNHLARVLPGE
ncbi:MAG TPA: AAA family ATPase [Baekduia sp.]|jgi:DNA-binding CsgD family transcriptional regulator